MTTQQPPDPDDRPSPWTPPRDESGEPYIDHPDPYERGLAPGGARRVNPPEPVYPPPPAHYAGSMPPPMAVYAQPTNGLATAGGVCGIVAAAISWIPIINFFSLVLSIVAVALGGVGLARANRLQRETGRPIGKGMAITGIVIGAVGLVAAALFIAAIGSALTQVGTTTTTP